jgi:hypothetical protein
MRKLTAINTRLKKLEAAASKWRTRACVKCSEFRTVVILPTPCGTGAIVNERCEMIMVDRVSLDRQRSGVCTKCGREWRSIVRKINPPIRGNDMAAGQE